jgi:hypothetical protein
VEKGRAQDPKMDEEVSPGVVDPTAMELLHNPVFLEKLNQFIFETPLEKKWLPPTKCSLEF